MKRGRIEAVVRASIRVVQRENECVVVYENKARLLWDARAIEPGCPDRVHGTAAKRRWNANCTCSMGQGPPAGGVLKWFYTFSTPLKGGGEMGLQAAALLGSNVGRMQL